MNDSRSLVAPSDIAEMAGVSRAAVSNWRRRAVDDFPKPVGGTAAKPLFDRADMVAWLRGRGYNVKDENVGARVWAAMNALRGTVQPEEAARLILSMACIRKLSAEFETKHPASVGGYDSPWELLLVNARSNEKVSLRDALHANPRSGWFAATIAYAAALITSSVPALASVVVELDRVPMEGLAEVTDFVLAKLDRAKIRAGVEHGFVESRVSTVLADLAAAAGGKSLYDPACGIGSALVATAERLELARIDGHDIDIPAVAQARQRAFLRDLPAEFDCVDILETDPLSELRVERVHQIARANLRADVVIAEPPYGVRHPEPFDPADRRWEFGLPTKNSSDFAWIQHAIAHLAPGGTAFIVTVAGALFKGGGQRAVRAELVRRGCVEAIVSLPNKMLPHISVSLAVWVLRPPHDADRHDIAFIDGTHTPDVENHVGDWLRTIRNGEDLDVSHAHVGVRDVLAADTDLNPTRWIQPAERDPAELAETYRTGWANLNEALGHLRNVESELGKRLSTRGARVMSVSDLVEQGILEVRQGQANPQTLAPELEPLLATAPQVRNAWKVRAAELEMAPDNIRVPAGLAGQLTQEGDLLVTTQPPVAVIVDGRGGHLPATGVYRVRVTNSDFLMPRYLELVLPGTWNDRFQVGSAKRADLRLLEIPLIPVTEQSKIVAADAAVSLAQHHAGVVVAEADRVRQSMLDAIRYDIELPQSGPA